MIELKQVRQSQKEILRNLLEKYNYEFSQYDLTDVNELGLYDYSYLDHYWTEPNRYAYFVYVDGRLAGFVMVNDHPEDPSRPMDHAMAEFCILYKYRRQGVGREAAFRVFDLHRGAWQLKYHPHNIASVRFWNRVVAEYTHGRYELAEGRPDVLYDDGTPADLLYFSN